MLSWLFSRFSKSTTDNGPRVVTVAIEALIAAGKTTLLNSLRDYENDTYKIVVIPEPLDQFEHWLGKFYEDTNRWAFTFQFVVFMKRVQHMRKTISEALSDARADGETRPLVCVVERSPYADYNCFAKMLHRCGKMSDGEFDVYKELFDFKSIPPIDHFVYLKTSYKTCMTRMAARNRASEINGGVTEDYMKSLENVHNEWLLPSGETEATGKTSVELLDGEKEHAEVKDAFIKFLDDIM